MRLLNLSLMHSGLPLNLISFLMVTHIMAVNHHFWHQMTVAIMNLLLLFLPFHLILVPLLTRRQLRVDLFVLALGLSFDHAIEEHLALTILFADARVIPCRGRIHYICP